VAAVASGRANDERDRVLSAIACSGEVERVLAASWQASTRCASSQDGEAGPVLAAVGCAGVSERAIISMRLSHSVVLEPKSCVTSDAEEPASGLLTYCTCAIVVDCEARGDRRSGRFRGRCANAAKQSPGARQMTAISGRGTKQDGRRAGHVLAGRVCTDNNVWQPKMMRQNWNTVLHGRPPQQK
jgi:hypothetical protein